MHLTLTYRAPWAVAVLLLLAAFVTVARAQLPTAAYQWAVRATNNGSPTAGSYANLVRLDAAGNVYLAGAFADTMRLGTQQLTAGPFGSSFVASYTATGRLAWLTQLHSPAVGLQLRNLATDAAGNSYVSGTFFREMTIDTQTLTDPNPQPARGPRRSGFVAKLDGQGRVQWALRIGAPATASAGNADCQGLAVDAQGNVAISGYYAGVLELAGQLLPPQPGGAYSSFTARLGATATGAPTVQWVHTNNPSSSENWSAVAFDAAGRLYAAYTYQAHFSDGGATLLHPQGLDATALLRYNAAGVVEWVQAVADPIPNGAAAIVNFYKLVPRATGGVYLLVACFSNTMNPVDYTQLAHYDAQGQPTWPQPLRQVGSWQAFDEFTTDATGNIYIGIGVQGSYRLNGQTVLQNSGADADAAVLCLTPQGDFAWALRASQGAGFEGFSCLAVRNGTDLYAVGTVAGAVQLGALSLPSASPRADLLVARLTLSLPTATQPAAAATLHLSPNPAHAFATLTLPAAPAARAFALLDALGRPVRHYTVPAGATTARLEVAGLPAGLYVLRGAGATRKLVLE